MVVAIVSPAATTVDRKVSALSWEMMCGRMKRTPCCINGSSASEFSSLSSVTSYTVKRMLINDVYVHSNTAKAALIITVSHLLRPVHD